MQNYSALEDTLILSLAFESLSQFITCHIKVKVLAPAFSKPFFISPFQINCIQILQSRLVPGFSSTFYLPTSIEKLQPDFLLVFRSIFINFPLTQFFLQAVFSTKDKTSHQVRPEKNGSWCGLRLKLKVAEVNQ